MGPDQQLDLVLEGGGVKGIGALGAALRLLDAGCRVERVAGTSVGAIVGAFLAAGADQERLRSIMGRLQLDRVADPGWPYLPVIGPVVGMLRDSGIYRGEYLHAWLRRELAALGVRTFADLRRNDPGDDANVPREHRYKLVVMATDITNGRLLRLPWDYERYGLVADEQPVADAVRMSMSVPYLFRSCVLDDRVSGGRATVVDGGVLSNFPVEVFDRTDGRPPRWPTWGVRILPASIVDLPSVLPLPAWLTPPQLRRAEQLLATMILGQDQSHLELPEVLARTIAVDTDGVDPFDFRISRRERDALVQVGWLAADRFLARQAIPAIDLADPSVTVGPAPRRPARGHAGP
jgi:NTE family protein